MGHKRNVILDDTEDCGLVTPVQQSPILRSLRASNACPLCVFGTVIVSFGLLTISFLTHKSDNLMKSDNFTKFFPWPGREQEKGNVVGCETAHKDPTVTLETLVRCGVCDTARHDPTVPLKFLFRCQERWNEANKAEREQEQKDKFKQKQEEMKKHEERNKLDRGEKNKQKHAAKQKKEVAERMKRKKEGREIQERAAEEEKSRAERETRKERNTSTQRESEVRQKHKRRFGEKEEVENRIENKKEDEIKVQDTQKNHESLVRDKQERGGEERQAFATADDKVQKEKMRQNQSIEKVRVGENEEQEQWAREKKHTENEGKELVHVVREGSEKRGANGSSGHNRTIESGKKMSLADANDKGKGQEPNNTEMIGVEIIKAKHKNEMKSCKGKACITDCHTAVQGELCYRHVRWAMHIGFRQHPQWYPGLTESSSFHDFQALLHATHHGHCSQPCMQWTNQNEDRNEDDDTDGKEAKDEENKNDENTNTSKHCHDAALGETCFEHVLWAKQSGIQRHPEWYPNLTFESRFEEFQAALNKQGHAHCRRPCKIVELK